MHVKNNTCLLNQLIFFGGLVLEKAARQRHLKAVSKLGSHHNGTHRIMHKLVPVFRL